MNIKNNKKTIMSAAVCVCVLFAVGIMVYAYFTSFFALDNQITIADNIIEISEVFDPPEEQSAGENLFRKDVSVTNTGAAPCYIRVYADFSNSFVRSSSYISADTDLDHLTFYSAERIINSEDDKTTFVEYINSGSDWVFIPDNSGTVLSGYYYYKEPLDIGQSTPSLFTYIKTINETEDDIDQFDILVYSESTQLTDINGILYEDYSSAWTDYLT